MNKPEIIHNQDHNFMFDMKTGLVVPKRTQEVEVRIQAPCVRAKYTLTKRHAESGDVVQEVSFYNMVLDTWLNTLGGDSATGTNGFCVGGVQIGTGTTPPQFTDTALQALVATTTNNLAGWQSFNNSSAPNYVTTTIGNYRFAQGALNGTFTEMGLRRTADAQTISRTLIKDGAGNPIGFTVTPIEVLDVSVATENWPPLGDLTYSVNVTGSGTHDCISRACLANDSTYWSNAINFGYYPTYGKICTAGGPGDHWGYSGLIGGITGSPSGSGARVQSAGSLAYSNNSYQRESNIYCDSNNGNIAGDLPWRSVLVQFGGARFQIQFTPGIAKTNTKALSLSLMFSWGRKV